VNPIRVQSTHGTVSLVALCLVTVTGIMLGSYLTLCSRAMTLSNRSYQAGVAQQLAEFGIEEGLRAFNKNNWNGWSSGGTSVAWDTTTYAVNKRAVAAVTFPVSKFGQGVVATVKIRIDNYDAAQLDSPWVSSVSYRVNDLVGDGGVWYRCLSDHTSNAARRPPNLDYWAPAPIPWSWSTGTTYTTSSATQNSSVVFNGTSWYQCTTGYTSATSASFSATPNWTAMPTPSLQWSDSATYAVGTFVFHSGTWYRCIAVNTGNVPPNASYWSSTSSPYISWSYRSGVTYRYNDVVFFSTSGSGTWYRCKVSSTGNAPTDTNSWDRALTAAWGWDSADRNYNLHDVVYYNSQWFRCISAHSKTSALPLTPGTSAGAMYWSNSPLFSTAWNSGQQYGINDTVSYNGVWYRCLTPTTSRPTPSVNWASAADALNQWSPTTNYTANTSYVGYGGVWYKCTANNIGQSPNNPDFWTPTWLQTAGITTGAAVIYAEASVAIANTPPIRVQLRAAINPAALFPNALGASTTIQTRAAGTIDSYDSADPSSSLPGYSAIVAAGSTGSTAVSLATTTVQGYLAAPPASTPPYAPLVSSGGSLKNSDGSVTSPAPGNMNLDLTRISRTPNIPQFDTVPRGAGGLLSTWGTDRVSLPLPVPLPTTTNIGTPGSTVPSRYYYDGNVTLSNISSSTFLNIKGPVILYIRGNLTLDGNTSTGNGAINITNTGSAEIHLTGALRVNFGSDGINNTTNDPKKLVIISDNSDALAQNYSDGSVPFYGVMYMPYTNSSAGLTLNDSASIRIYGALSAKKITYSVDANVHYDTSLRYATIPGVDQPYAATDWRILPATEQATMP